MATWISANIGTILICCVLCSIIAAIIAVLAKNKKQGKHSCGGNCGHCPMGGSCCEHFARSDVHAPSENAHGRF